MIDLDSDVSHSYIARAMGVADVCVTPLGGGVSNHVLLAEAGGRRWVFKQSLEKLRVEADWRSARERIWRECAAMRALENVLPSGAVPRIRFEDRANCIFGMDAAPADARPWKSALLEGCVDPDLAGQAGTLLGTWIRESALNPEWRGEFGDTQVFHELRLDPYYRRTAQVHPDLRGHFEGLISDCDARRVALVHGDLSPKNLLVIGKQLCVIDWEVVHWGDPSFDAAFLTNHLLLKGFHRPESRAEYGAAAGRFWLDLRGAAGPDFAWLEAAAIAHLGCLLLARIDGKSPAEYIQSPEERQRVREAARQLILSPPDRIEEVFA